MGLISSNQVVLENEVVCLGFKKKVPITIALDIAKLLECNFTIDLKQTIPLLFNWFLKSTLNRQKKLIDKGGSVPIKRVILADSYFSLF